MPGTDLAYGVTTRPNWTERQQLCGYGTRPMVLRVAYAKSGTDVGNGSETVPQEAALYTTLTSSSANLQHLLLPGFSDYDYIFKTLSAYGFSGSIRTTVADAEVKLVNLSFCSVFPNGAAGLGDASNRDAFKVWARASDEADRCPCPFMSWFILFTSSSRRESCHTASGSSTGFPADRTAPHNVPRPWTLVAGPWTLIHRPN